MALRSRIRDGENMAELKPGTKPVDRWERILVPALGRPFSARCVEIACRLAKSSGATLYLVYVLEIPRTYGLDAELPEEEKTANDVLEAAVAVAAPFKVPSVVARIHRVRVARDGILSFIGEQNIDLLALGARPDESSGLPRELARELFLSAHCEVVVDYIAGEEQMPMDEDFEED